MTHPQRASWCLPLPQLLRSCETGEKRLLRRQQRIAGLHGPGAPVQIPGWGAGCCSGSWFAVIARL